MTRPINPGNIAHAEIRAMLRTHQGDGYLTNRQLVAKAKLPTKVANQVNMAMSSMFLRGVLVRVTDPTGRYAYRITTTSDKLKKFNGAAPRRAAPAAPPDAPLVAGPVAPPSAVAQGLEAMLQIIARLVAAELVKQLPAPTAAAPTAVGLTEAQAKALVQSELSALETRLLDAFGGSKQPETVVIEPAPAPAPAPDRNLRPRVLIFRVNRNSLDVSAFDRLKVVRFTDFNTSNSTAARVAKSAWDHVLVTTWAVGHAEVDALKAQGHKPIYVSNVNELLAKLKELNSAAAR